MNTVSALPKFTNLARYISVLATAKGSAVSALPIAEEKYRNTPSVAMTLKAAIAEMGTGGDTAALAAYGLAQEIIELQRTASVEGRIAPFARRVPFQTMLPREIASVSASWVGQSRPIPVTNLTLDSFALERTKQSSIIVVTKELVTLMTQAAEAALIFCVKAGMGSSLDAAFLNPETAEVADTSNVGVIVSPASITNGATQISSTGSTAAAKLTDLTAMVAAISSLTYPMWVCSQRTAMSLAGTLTAGGALQFPGITMMGGMLLGAPVVTTAYMPASIGSPGAGEHYLILVDAADLLIADDGDATIDASEEASLQMVTNPTTGAASIVSLWQTGAVGIRISRTINWKRGHDGAVVYMRVSY